MGKSCVVPVCRNRSERMSQGWFRIPTARKAQGIFRGRREEWLLRIFGVIPDTIPPETRICKKHFISGQPSKWSAVDDPDWIPTQEMPTYPQTLPTDNSDQSVQESSMENGPEVVSRGTDPLPLVEDSMCISDSLEHVVQEAEVDHPEQDAETLIEDVFPDADTGSPAFKTATTQTVRTVRDCGVQVRSCHKYQSVAVQTEVTMQDLEELEKDWKECKEKLDALELNESAYKDNERTSYYTGLPTFATLMAIFNVVAPYLPYSHRNSLTKFQQFALTLMKLRLNLYFKDLGYRFNISHQTASRTFHKCVEVLFCRLKRNLFWPERHLIQSTMPLCFKASFGDAVTVIIDCFEITAERAGNLKAKAQTWSNYKHNQTVKFLIGITPQGFICFLSKPFGGRATDKNMTLTSGFLDNLQAGDLVMADRGFTISDAVQSCLAKVVTPAFTKGLQQLSPTEVERTREIANVRIHVERVIGCLRQKYLILTNRVPIELMSTNIPESKVTMEQIATVCCSLLNFCDSVVPSE